MIFCRKRGSNSRHIRTSMWACSVWALMHLRWCERESLQAEKKRLRKTLLEREKDAAREKKIILIRSPGSSYNIL